MAVTVTCFIHNGTSLSCKPGWRNAICTTRSFFFVFCLDKLMINNPSFSLFTTCVKYINKVNANFPSTVLMDGMDKIMNKDVFGTVNAILSVITWLVNAKKAVTWVGQDHFATKVIVSLFILNGLVNKYVNIFKSTIWKQRYTFLLK